MRLVRDVLGPMGAVVVATTSVEVGSALGHPLEGYLGGALTLVALALLHARGRRLGLLTPTSLYLLASSAYIIPTVVTLIVAGLLTDERAVGEAALARGALFSLVGGIAAAAGIGLAPVFAPRPRPYAEALAWWAPVRASLAAAGLAAIGVVAVTYLIVLMGGASAVGSASYGERYLLLEGKGVLLVGIQSIPLALLVMYAHAVRGRRYALSLAIAVGGTAVLFWWTIFFGMRGPLVGYLMGIVVIRQTSGRPIAQSTMLAGGMALAIAASIFATWRGITDGRASLAETVDVTQLNPANHEFGAAAVTVSDIVRTVPSEVPYRWGRTYLDAIGKLAPQAIWPGRPMAMGEWYVSQYYPLRAERGGAYAFSPAAEAYINFGPIGVAAVFVVIGLVIGTMDRRLAAYHVLPIWVSIYYALFAPWLLLFPRLDSASFLKSCLLLTLGQAAVLRYAARLAVPAASQSSARPVGVAVREPLGVGEVG